MTTGKLPDISDAGGPANGTRIPLRIEPKPPDEQLESVRYLDLGRIQRDGLPEVPWLVPGWIAAGDVAVIAGDGGIGKSTTVAALALALACGLDWCGITPVRSVRVLYFDEEQSDDELARIFLRLLPLGTAPPETLRVACGQGINLLAGIERLERELREHRPTLVVLDSVQQTFAGVDENSATAVGALFAELFRLRNLYGCAFLLVHHLKKPPGQGTIALHHLIRGSVAFFTQSSTAWVASQPAPNVLDLVQKKRRRGEKQTLRIRYEAPDGPNGPAILTGLGAIDAAESATERAEDFVRNYLAEHGESKRAAIVAAGVAAQFGEDVVDHALARLVTLRVIEKPRRGVYRLVGALLEDLPE